jgi:hypothetical protein
MWVDSNLLMMLFTTINCGIPLERHSGFGFGFHWRIPISEITIQTQNAKNSSTEM